MSTVHDGARRRPTRRAAWGPRFVGPITALAVWAGIDDAARFARPEDVRADFALTPRRYASGDVNRSGRITERGDGTVRTLLDEAANVLPVKITRSCALRERGPAIAKRSGSSRPLGDLRIAAASPSDRAAGPGSPRRERRGVARRAMVAVARTDPVENPSPGGRGPSETMLDRRDWRSHGARTSERPDCLTEPTTVASCPTVVADGSPCPIFSLRAAPSAHSPYCLSYRSAVRRVPCRCSSRPRCPSHHLGSAGL